MLSLHDIPRPLDHGPDTFTVWARVCGSEGGTRCGDVVATTTLPDARVALVVVDLIGGGLRRAPRAGAIGAHLIALLSLGVPPAAAVRFADVQLQSDGWEDEVPPLATVFAGFADPSNETLTYVSAAHETALILAPDGTHRHLECTGPLAGFFETPFFAQAGVPFRKGESLVVVTDGVPDSHCTGGPFFGSTGTVRTATFALRRGDDPAEALIADAMRHGGGANDAAALVVRHQARTLDINRTTLLPRKA
jgi:serine phosphatase RsbU (regulator of sigma subunit)